MTTLRRAVAINFLQNYGIIALQFVGSLILARLLAPAEVGIYSVAASLIAVAQTVRDFGVGQYIIQERDLTTARIRAAFAVALIVAAILALCTAAVSGIAADFFREPGIRLVLLVLSCNFLLIPFGQITLGYLHREMRFEAIAVVKITSAVVHTSLSVGLAYLGFSYMSLAWASLAGVLCSALVVSFFRPAHLPWLPGITEIRRVLHFGTFSVLGNLAIAVAKGVPDFVLGRMMSMTAVGLFSRAGSLIEIFHRGIMSALWSVALPHFSKTARDHGDVKKEFLHSAGLITGVAWPFFAVTAMLAEPLVLLLYGPDWIACAPIVKWICLGFALNAPFYLFGSVCIAMGKVHFTTLLEFGTLPLLVICFVVSASYGSLELVAVAYALYYGIKSVFIFFTMKSLLMYSGREFIVYLWRSVVLAVSAAGGCFIAITLLPDSDSAGSFMVTLAGGVGALSGWIIGLFVTAHPLSGEMERMVNSRNRNC